MTLNLALTILTPITLYNTIYVGKIIKVLQKNGIENNGINAKNVLTTNIEPKNIYFICHSLISQYIIVTGLALVFCLFF